MATSTTHTQETAMSQSFDYTVKNPMTGEVIARCPSLAAAETVLRGLIAQAAINPAVIPISVETIGKFLCAFDVICGGGKNALPRNEHHFVTDFLEEVMMVAAANVGIHEKRSPQDVLRHMANELREAGAGKSADLLADFAEKMRAHHEPANDSVPPSATRH
jgi:hypothetical protein